VVLVLDTSGSMAGAPLVAARASATRYVEQVPADVELGLVSAGAPAVVVLPPTRDRAAASQAIAGLSARGETALYDGVRAAAELISKGDWGQRRIVALSDGADTALISASAWREIMTLPLWCGFITNGIRKCCPCQKVRMNGISWSTWS
jgi:tight adherence protein B